MRVCRLCKKVSQPGNGTFFAVPKDKDRREKWSQICGQQFVPTSYICCDHFSRKHLITAGQKIILMQHAVPDKDLPNRSQLDVAPAYSSEIPKDERRKKIWQEACQVEFNHDSIICEHHFLPKDIIVGAKKRNPMPSAVPSVNLCLPEDPIAISALDARSKNATHINFHDPLANLPLDAESKKAKKIRIHGTVDVSLSDPLALTAETTRNVAVQTNISFLDLERKVQELETFNKKLQDEIKDLKLQLERKSKSLNSLKSIFTEGQLKRIMAPCDNARWYREDIANAIRLHANGAKAYNYLLKKGYPLPPVSTLEQWCRKVVISEGFLSTSLGFQRHCTELTDEDKICVLAFEEVKLDVEERYSQANTDHYAQVVVAQGLWKSWKRPVMLNFNPVMRKDVLYSIIDNLSKATFPVVAVITDMKPKNRKLWHDLDVSTVKPWFTSPANPVEKVFMFADAPHLLDRLRRQFVSTGLLWNGELILPRTIYELIQHDTNSDLGLTEEHLTAKGEEAQDMAPQLFSKRTAEAIRECQLQRNDIYKPNDTADFVELVNDWFSIMNSSINTFSSPGEQPFGIDLAEQKSTLMRMNKFLAYNIIPNKIILEDFQEGIIISNTALALMYDYVREKFGMTYVLTNRINHKELKHLLAALRNKVDVSVKLTSREIKARLKKYIYAQNMMDFHGSSSNENSTENPPTSINGLANEESVSHQDVEMNDIDPVQDKEDKETHDAQLSEEYDTENATYSPPSKNNTEKQKVTVEIATGSASERQILHEIVIERDIRVLDELDTANLGDVNSFVDDAMKYISADFIH